MGDSVCDTTKHEPPDFVSAFLTHHDKIESSSLGHTADDISGVTEFELNHLNRNTCLVEYLFRPRQDVCTYLLFLFGKLSCFHARMIFRNMQDAHFGA